MHHACVRHRRRLQGFLGDNTPKSPIAFFLLEKEDKPNPRSKAKFVGLNAANNVYKAWGSFLREPLYQWTRETNAEALKLNQHVSYIHSKFLLMDPLSKDPVVVTGSANFSKASTNDNDENMLVIRGERRVADIYFTEFNRLFLSLLFPLDPGNDQPACQGRERRPRSAEPVPRRDRRVGQEIEAAA